jgi:hypothetical protein
MGECGKHVFRPFTIGSAGWMYYQRIPQGISQKMPFSSGHFFAAIAAALTAAFGRFAALAV